MSMFVFMHLSPNSLYVQPIWQINDSESEKSVLHFSIYFFFMKNKGIIVNF